MTETNQTRRYPETRRMQAAFELAYTAVDFAAAT